MAWDFSTEPEFEGKLEWMRGFVRDEIIPLETIDLDAAAFERATRPLKEEVKARGLWAAHLPPELGGGGFGQVRLGLMHEILGQCAYAPAIFGNNGPTRATPNCSPWAPATSRRRSGSSRCWPGGCAALSR